MLKSVAIGLVATTIAASIAPAHAATTILGELQGDVLVNSGKGFQPVAAPKS